MVDSFLEVTLVDLGSEGEVRVGNVVVVVAVVVVVVVVVQA
jgi:hypothetical protein